MTRGCAGDELISMSGVENLARGFGIRDGRETQGVDRVPVVGPPVVAKDDEVLVRTVGVVLDLVALDAVLPRRLELADADRGRSTPGATRQAPRAERLPGDVFDHRKRQLNRSVLLQAVTDAKIFPIHFVYWTAITRPAAAGRSRGIEARRRQRRDFTAESGRRTAVETDDHDDRPADNPRHRSAGAPPRRHRLLLSTVDRLGSSNRVARTCPRTARRTFTSPLRDRCTSGRLRRRHRTDSCRQAGDAGN